MVYKFLVFRRLHLTKIEVMLTQTYQLISRTCVICGGTLLRCVPCLGGRSRAHAYENIPWYHNWYPQWLIRQTVVDPEELERSEIHGIFCQEFFMNTGRSIVLQSVYITDFSTLQYTQNVVCKQTDKLPCVTLLFIVLLFCTFPWNSGRFRINKRINLLIILIGVFIS